MQKRCSVLLYLQLFAWGLFFFQLCMDISIWVAVCVLSCSTVRWYSCVIYVICVCLRIVVPNTYCVAYFCLVCLRLVYPLLPVSRNLPFLVTLSVFFNVYLYIVPFDSLIPRKKRSASFCIKSVICYCKAN
jgi:hypothetical protein